MKDRGGRALQRLCVAGAILLFLVPLLPLAPAQGISDPWWGPSDRATPTAGFAIRVPITVENKFDYLLQDPFVAAEIDFGKRLIEAGWTNTTRGADTLLRGFTLDVGSIRVIPYNRGFVTGPVGGGSTSPIPHVFYPALFEGPAVRAADVPRNLAGTILFQIEGDLRPQEKKDFYVYANPIEYGKIEPPNFDPLTKSSLDSFLWGTTGTVTYGFEPHQIGQQHLLQIQSLASGPNKVTVSTFELSSFVPVVSTTNYPNPFTLQDRGNRNFYVPAGKAYKIESERPVRVTASGQETGSPSGLEATGYVPGLSGSFADDRFTFYVPPDTDTNVAILKAGPGSITVRNEDTLLGTPQRSLTEAAPINSIPVRAGMTTLSGTGKFLVSWNVRGQPPASLPATPYTPHQVPAITGGPSGIDFYAFLMNQEGSFHVCPETNASLRILRTPQETLSLYPEGTMPTVPYAFFAAQTFCEEIEVPGVTSVVDRYHFYSDPPKNGTGGPKAAPFRLFVDAGTRTDPVNGNITRHFLGPYGGLAGVDYDVEGPTGMFGHYNSTSVTIFEERRRISDGSIYVVNSTTGLRRDQFSPVDPAVHEEATGRYHIVANKPISVVSLAPAIYMQYDPGDSSVEPFEMTIPYTHHIPGRPVLASVTVGGADFRGPLVDLRNPTTPDLRQGNVNTGPGSPVSYRLDVLNLGRWVGGEDLPDTITVTCSTPAGWRVDGCAKEVTLGSRSAERLNVVVTPSVDDVNVSRTILVEARSKAGGVAATFNLSVRVEVRYGVGLWFDVEDGRKTIDPPVGVDPGETHEYTIVMKNTGSTRDAFDIGVLDEDAGEGWTQELLLDGEPVSELVLDGGESVLLTFRVRAPNAEIAPPNFVSIQAQSRSSALAADVVNTATRIRPKVDLELTLEPQTRLAEPAESVLFNISTRNKGNDVFTIYLEQDSILPKGWLAQMPLREITLSPNDSTVLSLRVTPPADARAGDLASVKIAAEVDTGGAGGRVPGDEISAVVVVRRVYNLTSPPIPDAETLPGTSLRYVLPITNRGNGQVSLELLPGAVEAALVLPDGDTRLVPDWRVTLESPAITLDLDQSTDLPLRIDVPAGTPAGLYNITFTTRLSREAIQNLTIPIDVKELSRVEFVGPSRTGLTPGRALTIGYVAANTGNVEGSFDLRASVPVGWQGSISPARARLAPGERMDVTLTLNATRDAPNGDVIVRLEAQAPPAAATPTDLRVDVARPQLYLSDVTGNGDLRAGELVLVSANVGNRGGIEATNVSVALLVDGRVVDRVLLARIPVGTSALATMSWVATQRGGDVKVVLDPDQEISLPTRDQTEETVEFGSRLGVPAPGVLALVALLGVAARFTARAVGEKSPEREDE